VNQKLALRQLEKLGYAGRAVGNGAEVLQEVQRVSYDVVLMDCQMPEMDGYEVTRKIREFEKRDPARVPVYIIAVTAHALDGDRERCLSAGMNDYLTKPLHIAQLEAALERAVRRRSAASQGDVVLDPVCIAGLKELREPGQADPLIELSDLFNRESDACLRRMDEGVAAQDANATARAAHSLKGSANNLGANRLASVCSSVEENARKAHWAQVAVDLEDLRIQLQRVRESLRAEVQAA
jgi:CheY-like chemotaxis protein